MATHANSTSHASVKGARYRNVYARERAAGNDVSNHTTLAEIAKVEPEQGPAYISWFAIYATHAIRVWQEAARDTRASTNVDRNALKDAGIELVVVPPEQRREHPKLIEFAESQNLTRDEALGLLAIYIKKAFSCSEQTSLSTNSEAPDIVLGRIKSLLEDSAAVLLDLDPPLADLEPARLRLTELCRSYASPWLQDTNPATLQRRTLEALKARERIDAETLAAALDIESDSAAHILWAMCAERVLVVDQEEDTALDTIFKPNPIIHFAFCDESDQRLTLSTLHTRVKAVKAFCDEHAE